MGSERSGGDDLGRILRLADGCDPTALALSAGEGYLLSRIDGHTPWRLLRVMGGIDADEADMVMEGWLATGVVEVAGHAAPPKQDRLASRARDVVREPKLPTNLDEAVRNDLDLDPEVQKRILAFEGRLGEADHAILDVKPGADAKEIKKAYFKLSKEFHPDRFFRRDIGDFKQRLDRIFKRVQDAYERLTNPPAASPTAGPTAGPEGAAESPGNERLALLKQRMPFKMGGSAVPEERKQRAREIFGEAIHAERVGRVVEALAQVRMALTFDPHDAEIKAKRRQLSLRYADERSREMLGDRSRLGSLADEELRELTDLLDELLEARTDDAMLHEEAAEVALRRERFDDAMKLVGRALEIEPEVASHHVTLGLVHKAKGEIGHAKKAIARALELDPQDDRARKFMATIRPGRPSAKGGNR
jgi:tetratricopeptide (TPR) repeat protein